MVALEHVENQYLGGDASLACSSQTQTKIDEMTVKLVARQYEKARKLLLENMEKLHEISAFLYQNETITGEQFMEILKK